MKKTIAKAIIIGSVLLYASCKKEVVVVEPITTAKKHSGDVAVAWMGALSDISRTTPYVPAPTARILAYSGIAAYESMVQGMPGYQSIYSHFTAKQLPYNSQQEYYWPAAANAAVARVASRVMANYSASPNTARILQLEDSLKNTFVSKTSAPILQASIDYGRTVADKIYDWSTTDGTLGANEALATCPAYTPPGIPGSWVPTPPAFATAAGACQGKLRTFIPGIVQAALPAAPPVYSTDPNSDFYKMAEKIYQVRTNRTPADSMISEAWRDRVGINFNTPAHIMKITSQIVGKEKLNLEDAVVIFVQQGIAMFDAIAAAFHAKYSYSMLRPITYIRSVINKPTWSSIYATPQHPSYPAVSPSAAAAGINILERKFGTQYNLVDSIQKSLYGKWTYTSLNDLVNDVGRSRTHSGLNFEISVTEGIKQGRLIGERVNALPFKR